MKRKILVVDDEENMLHMLEATLKREGYDVLTAQDGKVGIFHAIREDVQLILCDLKMPEMDGLAFLAALREERSDALVVMMSAFATIDTAVEAMKLGAFDFVTKPFKKDEIACVLEKAANYLALQEDNQALRSKLEQLQEKKSFASIIGKSQKLTDVLNLAEKVARYETTVLITGESGVGKELIAKGIVEKSGRAELPFVPVNCGSIPSSLMESEFFGHVKGAFSGADKDRNGLFEEANGGTIFLDEIGELPLDLQVKLLRVLQEREIRPVGSNITKNIDVRILAATAQNLEKMVRAGTFREDLYYRLNVVSLRCPPLRERRDDIPALTQHFLQKYMPASGRKNVRLSSGALDMLIAYDWPGNVRELENCIERALVVAESEIIEESDLQLGGVSSQAGSARPQRDLFQGICSIKEGKMLMEKHLITKVLRLTEGNKSQAAQMLEISYPSLLAKIKELHIDQP